MAQPHQKLRRLEERFAREDKNRRDVGLAHLVQSAEGRFYLWSLLEACRVFAQPFNGNALETAFRCGEQNIGQQILAHLNEVSPDAFFLMMKENQDVRLERNNARNRARGDATED